MLALTASGWANLKKRHFKPTVEGVLAKPTVEGVLAKPTVKGVLAKPTV